MTAFVSYIRVSTAKQGTSGLGLDAQRRDVNAFVDHRGSQLIREFHEIESATGKRRRPVLAEALAYCRLTGCSLVVAKVDRLVRNVDFLSKIRESGVSIAFCDLPQVEGPQGRFILNQMAAVAELEAGLISQRTRAALAEAKRRGVRLGNPNGAAPLRRAAKGNVAAVATVKARAHEYAQRLAPVVQELRPGRSLLELARKLTASGIRTSRGSATWTSCGVARLLARLDQMAR